MSLIRKKRDYFSCMLITACYLVSKYTIRPSARLAFVS